MLFLLLLINVLFAVDPSKVYEKTPKDYGLKYQEITIKSDENIKLNTWIISESEKYNDILIMLNSDTGNMSNFLPYAKYVSSTLKKTVVLFDYRGYGKSSNFTISKYALSMIEFVSDTRAVIKYLNEKHPKAKISLYGFSMGASIALLTSKNENIEGLFLDSPMLDPVDVKARISNKNVFLDNEEQFNLVDKADQIRANEVFIIQGKNDNVVDVNITTNFYSQIKARKNILIMENNRHGDLTSLYPDLYLNFLKTFLIN
jgi:alpha/beta superfamily hydrolase